ncbi:MAG: TIGR04282 family arsenosugar biosynthesis glycosyltransferase [Pelagimonas sp.]|nr:TIGR04282 family arsenosugar biosynthesis glycosyltransferase [Pelagimonas sp.]
MKPTLIVMVKQPRAGRVKTRLGRDMGMTAAAWWFRHQVAGLLRRIRDPRWTILLAVAPDTAVHSGDWPRDVPRVAQGHGDLGARMKRALRAAPPGPVCLIGGDVPGVTRQVIAQAFEALKGQDAVFGPAEDGGFWLVGVRNARAVPERLFHGARWSTECALLDTVASIPGARIDYATTLNDVDTVADLRPRP